MLFFEIFENERALAQFLSDQSQFEGKTSLIMADNREVLDKILGKGKEWYRINYRGPKRNLTRYLSTLKIECLRDYYLHINLPQNDTLQDLQSVVLEICENKNCMKNAPALRCTNDPTLGDDEVEVTIVVPVFDLGWQLDQMWQK